jgi:hypothetical protein
MKRVRKPARSLEAALEVVETGIEKIVAGLHNPPAAERKPNRGRPVRSKAHSRAADKTHAAV